MTNTRRGRFRISYYVIVHLLILRRTTFFFFGYYTNNITQNPRKLNLKDSCYFQLLYIVSFKDKRSLSTLNKCSMTYQDVEVFMTT